MSEHQDKDDITPLEYFVSGLVVLLFGLLYFFINHGEGFMSGGGRGALSLAAPAVTAAVEPGIGNKLLADNSAEVKMPSANNAEADDKADAVQDEVTEEKTQAPAAIEVVKEQQAAADKERRATEKALRAELAAERERADAMARRLAVAEKLLAAEKANNAEITQETAAAQSPLPVQQVAQIIPTIQPSIVPDTSDNISNQAQQQVYRLPDGTEIPVADDGFEGAVKAAMDKQVVGSVALMNEPMLFDDISFESGSARLSAGSQQQIKALAALMNTYQDRKILIRGHTDNIGGVNTNSLLSLTRSDSMKKQLVGLGIDKNRIKLEGVGQLEPLASNDTEEGRRKNRRIELILME